jgi:hypothetical protein
MHGGAGPRGTAGEYGYGAGAGVGGRHNHMAPAGATDTRHHVAGGSEYVQYGSTAGSGPAPTTAGPHRHDLMNKLDPRVDSTADNRPVAPNSHSQHSRIADAMAPPVVESSGLGRTGRVGAGAGAVDPTHHHGMTGRTGPGNAAAYDREYQTGVGGTGMGNSTTAPHSSKLMNKLDPRVDSREFPTNSGYGARETNYPPDTRRY